MNNFYRSDGWVKTTLGPAVSGAQVYVLSQPANVTPPVTPPRSTPVPFTPNPQVQIYSDAGFTPITQPVITDGYGHYDFYVLPGLYTVAIYYGGKLQQYYVDQSIGNVGSTQATPVVLSTNGTPNFNQSLLNLVQGPLITVVTDNLGNSVISGVLPPTMTNLVGGLVPTPPNSATEYLDGTGHFSIPPSGSSVLLETNGIHNGSQSLLNLVNGAGVSITQDGAGNVTVAAPPVVAPRNIWTGNDFSSTLTFAANTGPGGTNGEVFTYPFYLSMATVIGHISQQQYGGPYGGGAPTYPAGCYTCAIYTLDGTTKLVDAGPAAFSALSSGFQTKAITPVTLPAGAYRFAFSFADATTQVVYGVSISDSPSIWNVNSTGVPLVASCSAIMGPGGAMPAALGAFTANTNTGWPSFLLEP